MKHLYFGLMCIYDSLVLSLLAGILSAIIAMPLQAYFAVTTMWEQVAVWAVSLLISLLIGSSLVALAKALLEKKDEKPKS